MGEGKKPSLRERREGIAENLRNVFENVADRKGDLENLSQQLQDARLTLEGGVVAMEKAHKAIHNFTAEVFASAHNKVLAGNSIVSAYQDMADDILLESRSMEARLESLGLLEAAIGDVLLDA